MLNNPHNKKQERSNCWPQIYFIFKINIEKGKVNPALESTYGSTSFRFRFIYGSQYTGTRRTTSRCKGAHQAYREKKLTYFCTYSVTIKILKGNRHYLQSTFFTINKKKFIRSVIKKIHECKACKNIIQVYIARYIKTYTF